MEFAVNEDPTIQRATCSFVGVEGGADDFAVSSFEGVERLNVPYYYTVNLVLRDEEVDPDRLLGKEAVLTIEHQDRLRPIQGIVERVVANDRERHAITAVLVPALVASRYTTTTRIFQNLTALDIVEQVLNEDLARYQRTVETSDLDRARFTPRDYCVQFRETNLDFVHRLLEEEGVGYYFRAGDDAEILVLFEETRSLSAVETREPGPIRFHRHRDDDGAVEHVFEFSTDTRLTTRSVTVRDHDWARGRPTLEASAAADPSPQQVGDAYEHGLSRSVTIHEDPGLHAAGTAAAIAAALPLGLPLGLEHRVHNLPGAMLPPWTSSDVDKQAQIRRQQLHRDRRTFRGAGSVSGFMPGALFELMGEPRFEGKYTLTKVTHRAEAIAGVDAHRSQISYQNEFECLSENTQWRPDRVTPKPRIHGVQTAKVTGPVGMDVYTDPLGRVKVIFNWDRAPFDPGGNHTCWLRVSQIWAGQGAPGFSFIPRVGMEVVVTFVDGDPDRPLVIGCVNNAENPTPGLLPVQATKSIIRTRTVPHGPGHNEISFEDAMGMERVHIRAERDLDELVRHNRYGHVHNDAKDIVVGDRLEVTRGDARTVVGSSSHSQVQADRFTSTGGNATTRVGGATTFHAGGDIHFSARRGSIIGRMGDGAIVIRSDGLIKFTLGDERFIQVTPDNDGDGVIELINGKTKVKLEPAALRINVGETSIVATETSVQINGKTFPTSS